MMIVELDIFSGRPNPRWKLSATQEKKLTQRILSQPSLVTPIENAPSRLGYRGFIISTIHETSGKPYHIQAGASTLPSTFRIASMAQNAGEVSQWLLESNDQKSTTLDQCIQDHVDQQLQADLEGESQPGETVIVDQPFPFQKSISPQVLPFCCASNYFTGTDQTFWNSTYSALHYNNCYNFASNYRVSTSSVGFALPGLQSGQPLNGSFSNMNSALQSDGWLTNCGSSDNITICYVIWPGVDFHFYRFVTTQNGTYIWGHKPGCTVAKITDNSGKTITDPETCNRGSYTQFGAYYFAYRSRTVKGYGPSSACL